MDAGIRKVRTLAGMLRVAARARTIVSGRAPGIDTESFTEKFKE